MTLQEREELIRKADIAIKDLIPNGGLLNEDQQTRFVEALKEDPWLIEALEKDPWIVRVTLWVKWWFKRIVYILFRR